MTSTEMSCACDPGEMVDVQGIPCYVVGTGEKTLLVAHDIFGVDSGRTKLICDRLSSELNLLVCLPAFFDGSKGAGGQAAANVENLLFPDKGASIFGAPLRLFATLWRAPSLIGDIICVCVLRVQFIRSRFIRETVSGCHRNSTEENSHHITEQARSKSTTGHTWNRSFTKLWNTSGTEERQKWACWYATVLSRACKDF